MRCCESPARCGSALLTPDAGADHGDGARLSADGCVKAPTICMSIVMSWRWAVSGRWVAAALLRQEYLVRILHRCFVFCRNCFILGSGSNRQAILILGRQSRADFFQAKQFLIVNPESDRPAGPVGLDGTLLYPRQSRERVAHVLWSRRSGHPWYTENDSRQDRLRRTRGYCWPARLGTTYDSG
jgi:hypothetical protein